MKILILAPYQSPIVSRLLKALKKKNIEVVLASFNAKDVDGVEDLGDLNSFFDYMKFWKLHKLIKLHNPDVIHAHISTHYGLLSLLTKKPLVVALWGSEIMLDPYNRNFVKRQVVRIINYLVLKRSNACHTSGKHIANKAELFSSGVLDKIDVFYWGFPLSIPSKSKYKQIDFTLKSEFRFLSEKFIVFPRGLNEVYDPNRAALLAQKLSEDARVKEQIIILRGYASEVELNRFRDKIKSDKVLIIDRLLNESELCWLYSNSRFHFSIPVSDALGGGVIEPMQLGSYPILSNIAPYREFVNDYCGYIIEDELNDYALDALIRFIQTSPDIKENVVVDFKEDNIVDGIVKVYAKGALRWK